LQQEVMQAGLKSLRLPISDNAATLKRHAVRGRV